MVFNRIVCGIGLLILTAPVVAGGPTPDCNSNGVLDEIDVSSGTSLDCNQDLIPDECQLLAPFLAASGPLSPLDNSNPQSFVISDAPEALSNVRLSFVANTFFLFASMRVDIDLNGVSVGTIAGPMDSCVDNPAEILVDQQIFNDAVNGGDAVINMIPTSAVGPACPGSFISVDVSFSIENDCNVNLRPDDCDVNEPSLFAVAKNAEHLFLVDSVTGSQSIVGSSSIGVFPSVGLASQPGTGELFFLAGTDLQFGGNRQLGTKDQATGEEALIGVLAPEFHISDIAFQLNGNLIGIKGGGGSGGSLHQINVNSAATSDLGISGGPGPGQSIALDPASDLLFHTFDVTQLETINLNDGSSTSVGALQIGAITAITFHPSGSPLLGYSRKDFYEIDPITAAVTPRMINTGAHVNGLAFSFVSQDCNLDQTPDECQLPGNNCNSNGILDDCEIGKWIGPDSGGFENPDNWDIGVVPGVSVLLTNASGLDNRAVISEPGTTEACILTVEANGTGKQILDIQSGSHLSASSELDLNDGGELLFEGSLVSSPAILNQGGVLSGYGTLAGNIFNRGLLHGRTGQTLILNDGLLNNQLNGTLLAPVVSLIQIDSSSVIQRGLIQIMPNASLVYGQSLNNGAAGRIELLGGLLSTQGLDNSNNALVDGFGQIASDVDNEGEMIFIADSQIVGSVVNQGTITVQNGTLTVTGGLSGGGVLIGDISARDSGGFAIIGDQVLSSTASISIADGVLKVGGAFDVAIDDHQRFDMVGAELRMIGLGATTQTLEVMSRDIGAASAGLDRNIPGHYPLNSLRIGPTATTVQLTDAHDNDGLGQATCEAIYTNQLSIDSSASLLTGNCKIYYHVLSNQGFVDQPSNLVKLTTGMAGDIDADGDVDLDDLQAIVAVLLLNPLDPQHPARSDLNNDGNVDGLDVQVFVDLILGSG